MFIPVYNAIKICLDLSKTCTYPPSTNIHTFLNNLMNCCSMHLFVDDHHPIYTWPVGPMSRKDTAFWLTGMANKTHYLWCSHAVPNDSKHYSQFSPTSTNSLCLYIIIQVAQMLDLEIQLMQAGRQTDNTHVYRVRKLAFWNLMYAQLMTFSGNCAKVTTSNKLVSYRQYYCLFLESVALV